MTFLLANWRVVLFVLIVLALGVQTGRISILKAEHAEFVANTEKVAAEAQAKNALERARIEANSTEAVSDLQTRLDALNARYDRLRADSGSGGVPNLASAASRISSCPDGRDALARRLGEIEAALTGVLESGDKELNKYRELWELQQKNAVK